MIGTDYYNWQRHTPAPDPAYPRCSPNLVALYNAMARRWGCTHLGCFGVRPIRGGTAPSTHSFGAARDIRYGTGRRTLVVDEIIPWLIGNSHELHISAIHDYLAARIWHADRADIDDAYSSWWHPQPVSTVTGMGQAWAVYFHIETTPAGWHDATPVDDRAAAPLPTPGGFFVHTTLVQGAEGAEVYALQIILRKLAGQINVVADGHFGPITAEAVRNVQLWYTLTPDGVVGPITWAKLDQLVNA
jgi:hypothetical protein